MGFHKMSDELIWGDDQGEIAHESIVRINDVFLRHFGRPAHRAELFFGFICAINSYLDEFRPRPKMKIVEPPTGETPPGLGDQNLPKVKVDDIENEP